MSVREISETNLYQNGNGNNKSTECLTCLAAGDSVCDIVYCTSSETRFLSPSPRIISRTMVAIIFVAGMIALIAVVWMIFQMDMEQCQVKKFLAASASPEAFSRQYWCFKLCTWMLQIWILTHLYPTVLFHIRFTLSSVFSDVDALVFKTFSLITYHNYLVDNGADISHTELMTPIMFLPTDKCMASRSALCFKYFFSITHNTMSLPVTMSRNIMGKMELDLFLNNSRRQQQQLE